MKCKPQARIHTGFHCFTEIVRNFPAKLVLKNSLDIYFLFFLTITNHRHVLAAECYIQSTTFLTPMAQMRLTGLALLHIHRNTGIDIDEIIRRLARLHPRRMEISSIMSE